MKRFRTRKSDNNSNNNSNNISNNFSNINSNNFSNNFSNNNKNTNNKNKTKKSLSITKLAEIKRKNMLSSETILNSKTMKLTHINATPKPKKKSLNKKNQNMNKKLNTISKNIKRANDSINNPNEFYMNFFNNIIAKESKSINGEENREKFKSSKILKIYSSSKLKETQLSKSKKSLEQSLLDSFISLKENKSKDSFKKMKTKQKSGFKYQL
jgi:hypothetical protein